MLEENKNILIDLMFPMKIDPILKPLIQKDYDEMERRRKKLICSKCGRVKKKTRDRLKCQCRKKTNVKGLQHDLCA